MVHAGWGQWFARNAPGMRSPAPQKTTMGRPNGVGHESTGRDGGEKSMGPSSAGKRASTPRAAAGAARSARTPETPAIPASLQRFAIQHHLAVGLLHNQQGVRRAAGVATAVRAEAGLGGVSATTVHRFAKKVAR